MNNAEILVKQLAETCWETIDTSYREHFSHYICFHSDGRCTGNMPDNLVRSFVGSWEITDASESPLLFMRFNTKDDNKGFVVNLTQSEMKISDPTTNRGKVYKSVSRASIT